jgi:CHAT domain-containing protein
MRITHEIENQQDILERFRAKPPENAEEEARLVDTGQNLSALEAELAALDAAITVCIPQYAELRNAKPVSGERARAWCGADTAVLEYVLWDDSIDFKPITILTTWEGMTTRPPINSYCLVLTKDGITPVVLDHDFDYNQTVKNFREQVSGPLNPARYEKARNDLYAKLVKPVLSYLPASVKNIVIVPDGELAYLPFDIFRESNASPDFGETYTLSPSVSVSVLGEKDQVPQNGSILSFADAV